MAKGHITKLETKTLNKKMTTTTTTNTNNNTQQQRTSEEEERQRDCWSDRVNGALFRKTNRMVLAANALFGTPEWVKPDLSAVWFWAEDDQDVTRRAAVVEECLDDARAHAKRKGRALPPLEYLPRGILESEALEPYLKRWKRDNDAAAISAAAAAPTRARCAYPLLL